MAEYKEVPVLTSPAAGAPIFEAARALVKDNEQKLRDAGVNGIVVITLQELPGNGIASALYSASFKPGVLATEMVKIALIHCNNALEDAERPRTPDETAH